MLTRALSGVDFVFGIFLSAAWAFSLQVQQLVRLIESRLCLQMAKKIALWSVNLCPYRLGSTYWYNGNRAYASYAVRWFRGTDSYGLINPNPPQATDTEPQPEQSGLIGTQTQDFQLQFPDFDQISFRRTLPSWLWEFDFAMDVHGISIQANLPILGVSFRGTLNHTRLSTSSRQPLF